MAYGNAGRLKFPNILLFLAFLNMVFICYLMTKIFVGHELKPPYPESVRRYYPPVPGKFVDSLNRFPDFYGILAYIIFKNCDI